MPQLVNLQQVCTITVNPKKRVYGVNYEEFSGYLGLIDWLCGKKRPKIVALVKNSYNGDYILEGKNLEDELYDESAYIDDKDNQLYHYPHVKLKMANDRTETKWFDTEEQLNAWVIETTTKVPTIVLLRK